MACLVSVGELAWFFISTLLVTETMAFSPSQDVS